MVITSLARREARLREPTANASIFISVGKRHFRETSECVWKSPSRKITTNGQRLKFLFGQKKTEKVHVEARETLECEWYVGEG